MTRHRGDGPEGLTRPTQSWDWTIGLVTEERPHPLSDTVAGHTDFDVTIGQKSSNRKILQNPQISLDTTIKQNIHKHKH